MAVFMGKGDNPTAVLEKRVSPFCSGWWFGTFFIFPNSWDDDPI